MKKFKCENCEYCKLIDSTGKISCNYLFNNGGLYQPKYCPNYKEKQKMKIEYLGGRENGSK